MSVSIFFCYAHEDEALLKKLKAHLRPLQRQGLIDVWHDRDISAGTEWEQEIKKHLNEAKIILFLVSPDFMDSDYCYGIEMQQALERHQRGEARVIPIILRPVHWQGILGNLKALPTDAKPVKSWSDIDEAFFDVTEGIHTVVVELGLRSLLSFEVIPSQASEGEFAAVPHTVLMSPSAKAHYHNCVISYSTEDQQFVNKLYGDLKARGVPCWLADQDGKISNKLRLEIYQAISQLDKVVLILSKNAIESPWVEEEVDVALDHERQHPGTLLPRVAQRDSIVE